jgi:glutamyl-tRNA synthetase
MKERATFPKDIYENGKFFFEAPTSYDEKASKKAWNDETSAILGNWLQILKELILMLKILSRNS